MAGTFEELMARSAFESDFLPDFDYKNPHDVAELEAIVSEVSKYDIFDFITSIAALNLIPENQNKSILFNMIISALLTRSISSYTSKAKMSSGRFRKIINRVERFDLKNSIDPPENCFVERVFYYGNYLVFPGNNYSPGYIIQGIINVLFLRDNVFDKEFLYFSSRIIEFVLRISNSIALRLNYDIDSLERRNSKNIIIPDASTFASLKESVKINNEEVSIESKLIYSEFGLESIENVFDNKQPFFSRPFIKVDKNETIILDPTVLCSFAVHKIVMHAQNRGGAIKTNLINAYNSEVFKDCKKSLQRLGHNKIKENELGLELISLSNYKEEILNVVNDQLLIIFYLCDDGAEYINDSSFFSRYPSILSERFNSRMNFLIEKLSENSIQHVYQIIVFNTFGRSIGVRIDKRYRVISLMPFELKCISINEANQDAFLARYIKAKKKLNVPSNITSEINSIEIYTSNDYSFYINDDFNPKRGMFLIAPGDSIDYILRAMKKEDRQLVDSYREGYLQEVIIQDAKRNIYIDPKINKEPEISLCVLMKDVLIWITSSEITHKQELDIFYSIVDSISYWISECKVILNQAKYKFKVLEIHAILTGNIEEYNLYEDIQGVWNDFISFVVDENKISMIWTSEAFKLLNAQDNSIELEMVKSILVNIEQFCVNCKLNLDYLNLIFYNPNKKKFVSLDYTSDPYFKPLNRKFIRIRSEDENDLLDEIGQALLTSGKWTYGIIDEEQRPVLANQVVDYLYKKMQNEIRELDSKNFQELICYDLEVVMFNLMLSQKRHVFDVACYPEKSKDYIQSHNELNQTSSALKFLAEYVAACPPNGEKILGKLQYERILAICSLIINWAYKNDLFYYNIFKTPVEILSSGRVGMKQVEYNHLNEINSSLRSAQLIRLSDPLVETFFPRSVLDSFQDKIDPAFMEEYGYSFSAFTNCVFEIIEFGNSIDNEVKRVDIRALKAHLVVSNIDEQIATRILNQISLTNRNDFLVPNEPYKIDDVKPWRFNRELSFTRRPMVIRDDIVIWGNRQLYHMWTFVVDLILQGKLKARSKALKTLIGKMSDQRGAEFNEQVYLKLSKADNIIVQPNVKKINHKRICDEKGNTLGDIDVLYIIPYKKKIIVAEVKDFSFSKNPYEMDQEYKRMFVDTDGKLCYASRSKRRADWIKYHLDDVKSQYGLAGEGWSVKDIFIVSHDVVSNAFYNVGQTIITYSDLTAESMEQI